MAYGRHKLDYAESVVNRIEKFKRAAKKRAASKSGPVKVTKAGDSDARL